MLRKLFCVFLCSAAAGTAVLAHHSYGLYDREHPTSIEGTLQELMVANPHGMLTVRTDNGTVFVAEWGSVNAVERTGYRPGMLSVGDRVVITGAPARDASDHRLALVSDIRRPRDGWQWTKNGVISAQ